MKKTRYARKFDYVESVLLSLGTDLKEIQTKSSNYGGNHSLRNTSHVFVVKRLKRLEHIKKCLEVIYKDVNEETKKLINFLYIENIGFEETSKELNIKERNLFFRHNLIVDEMMILLGEVREGEKKKRIKRRRAIPKNVKEKVFKRDEGKCVSCGMSGTLHYHHIKRYSSGGKNTVDNLILLCVDCHAEEHKDESSYHLLKAMAER